MHTIDEVVNKCYELVEKNKNDIFIKATWDPKRVGWGIGIWQNENAYRKKPAIGNFILEQVYVDACFQNQNCDKWKTLLEDALKD